MTPERLESWMGTRLLHGDGEGSEGRRPSAGVDGDYGHLMRAQSERRSGIKKLVPGVEVSIIVLPLGHIRARDSQSRHTDGGSVDVYPDVAQRSAILRIGNPAAHLQRIRLAHRGASGDA